MSGPKKTTEKKDSFKRAAENRFRAENDPYYAPVKKSGKQIKQSLNPPHPGAGNVKITPPPQSESFLLPTRGLRAKGLEL